MAKSDPEFLLAWQIRMVSNQQLNLGPMVLFTLAGIAGQLTLSPSWLSCKTDFTYSSHKTEHHLPPTHTDWTRLLTSSWHGDEEQGDMHCARTSTRSLTFSKTLPCTWLSSGLLRHVVWKKFADVSEVLAASIIRALSPWWWTTDNRMRRE
jgi:hypothetical protein